MEIQRKNGERNARIIAVLAIILYKLRAVSQQFGDGDFAGGVGSLAGRLVMVAVAFLVIRSCFKERDSERDSEEPQNEDPPEKS